MESHRQRQFKRKVYFYIILIVALTIFLSTFGFKFLITSGIFISNMFTKEETTQATPDDFFGSLDIDQIPTATNSATFLVSGSAPEFDSVEFYINGKKVKSTVLTGEKSFSKEIGDLRKGSNKVYVKALTKKADNTRESDTYTVIYSNDKPKLEISEPVDNSTTGNYELKVAGKTTADITIRINDFPVVVDSQGSFQTFVRLSDGENKIKVDAIDDAGNTETKTLTVTYHKD